MKSYMDRKWAVLGPTILNYSGNDTELTVPARFADLEVSAIGDAAFMESYTLKRVVIPSHITSIGNRVFDNCTELEDVYVSGNIEWLGDGVFYQCHNLLNLIFVDIPMSEQSYTNLIASCTKASGSVYAAHTFPKLENVKRAVVSTGAKPALTFPKGIERLFMSRDIAKDVGFGAIMKPLERLVFAGFEEELFENKAVLITDASDGFLDREAELKNDEYERVEKSPRIDKTAVFTFDNSKTVTENDTVKITANVKIGYFFWQFKVPVKHNGKDYFVYRRHYLSSNSEMSYIRRDMAVFSGGRPVTDKKEAMEVYAKYKLLSIL